MYIICMTVIYYGFVEFFWCHTGVLSQCSATYWSNPFEFFLHIYHGDIYLITLQSTLSSGYRCAWLSFHWWANFSRDFPFDIGTHSFRHSYTFLIRNFSGYQLTLFFFEWLANFFDHRWTNFSARSSEKKMQINFSKSKFYNLFWVFVTSSFIM